MAIPFGSHFAPNCSSFGLPSQKAAGAGAGEHPGGVQAGGREGRIALLKMSLDRILLFAFQEGKKPAFHAYIRAHDKVRQPPVQMPERPADIFIMAFARAAGGPCSYSTSRPSW
jgi:hypothetical protein